MHTIEQNTAEDVDMYLYLQAKAAESEKEESSNQAASLNLQLQNLISSRDRNQQALKVRRTLGALEHSEEAMSMCSDAWENLPGSIDAHRRSSTGWIWTLA